MKKLTTYHNGFEVGMYLYAYNRVRTLKRVYYIHAAHALGNGNFYNM